ncbi:MAG: isopenicillin N synthase family dioxygenase [Ilumatobacter sp.]
MTGLGPLPIVDIAGFEAASSTRRTEIAGAVDQAYRTIGFLEVTGHGVDPGLIASMQAVTTEYFDQALDVKMADMRSADANRGYTPPGAEALSYSLGLETPPDMFQAFNAGAQIHTVDPATRPEHHASLYQANVWPDTPAEMRGIWEEYMAAVADLGQRMLGIMAVAFGLDPDFFASKAAQAPDVLRALDYRSDADSPPLEPGQLRLGAHTDYGMCTMLYADPVPGLQLLGSDDVWRDVTPTPGHYVINIGDMMAAWTNDQWRSTVHRVVPAAPGAAMHRRSMAYFHEADPDAMIEPLACCVSDDVPAKYAPISAGDHLRQKILSSRDKKPADTAQTTADRRDALLIPSGGSS